MNPSTLAAIIGAPNPAGSAVRHRHAATPSSHTGKKEKDFWPGQQPRQCKRGCPEGSSQEYRNSKQYIVPGLIIERPEWDVEAGQNRERPALAEKNRRERIRQRWMRRHGVPFRPIQCRIDCIAEVIEQRGQDEGR